MAISLGGRLAARAGRLGERALARLRAGLADTEAVVEVRGRGLMLGIECARPADSLAATQALLERGYVLLPSGDDGRVLSVTPPLCIERDALRAGLEELLACLA